LQAQKYAAYTDNRGRFIIFDDGRTIEAEYIPVKSFSIGGTCILYVDNRNNLKMYYDGKISSLVLNFSGNYSADDYLAIYSQYNTVKIIENGNITTISTYSVLYEAQDSLVTFYDQSKQLLAVYYKGRINMLVDGLAGYRVRNDSILAQDIVVFNSGDNILSYFSPRKKSLEVFYRGESAVIEPFLSGGAFKTGRDIVAFINQADQKLKIFYKSMIFQVEEFEPESWKVGDGIAAWVDNMGNFKVFAHGVIMDISSFRPDFYTVKNNMIIFGDQGYFKVWFNDKVYSLENYIPVEWLAEWNTLLYIDQNRNVRIFSNGENRVLTYDIVESIALYRDIVVVNKGMNNHNVYYKGRKY